MNDLLNQITELRMQTKHNEIVINDPEYLDISAKQTKISKQLDDLNLPKHVMLLIDDYCSIINLSGYRFGELAYQLGLSDGIKGVSNIISKKDD